VYVADVTSIALPSEVVQLRVWTFVAVVAVNVPVTAAALFVPLNPFATAMPATISETITAETSVNLRMQSSPSVCVCTDEDPGGVRVLRLRLVNFS
jgi:hypothetical protein